MELWKTKGHRKRAKEAGIGFFLMKKRAGEARTQHNPQQRSAEENSDQTQGVVAFVLSLLLLKS